MTKPFVSYFKDKNETWTQEKCYITENLNTDRDPSLSVAQARVRPGETTIWHRLRDTTERYVILSGTGAVEVGETMSADIGPGDVVFIPPGMKQRITNTGDEPLVFYALCTPRFLPENYESLGEPES